MHIDFANLWISLIFNEVCNHSNEKDNQKLIYYFLLNDENIV